MFTIPLAFVGSLFTGVHHVIDAYAFLRYKLMYKLSPGIRTLLYKWTETILKYDKDCTLTITTDNATLRTVKYKKK